MQAYLKTLKYKYVRENNEQEFVIVIDIYLTLSTALSPFVTLQDIRTVTFCHLSLVKRDTLYLKFYNFTSSSPIAMKIGLKLKYINM